jgi:predicted metal-dependent hydrolase
VGKTGLKKPSALKKASLDVEVRRSQRRHRTVSAYRDGGRVVILIPDQFTRAEEREWVDKMLERLSARDHRRKRTDAELTTRAIRLAKRYLPEHPDAAEPISVRWVANQNGRWGSCTPADGTIRISARIQDMPQWVIDYVVLHEVVHLVVPSHDAEFWALVSRYPKAERARGYLEGVAAITGTPIDED